MKLGYLSFDRTDKFRLFALTDFSCSFPLAYFLFPFFSSLTVKKALNQIEIEKKEDNLNLTTNTFNINGELPNDEHNEKNFITVRKDEKILRAVPQSVMAKYAVKNRTYLNK